MLSTHALDRLPVRLFPEERKRLASTADTVAAAIPQGSAAVRLARLAPDRLVTLDGFATNGAAITVDARQDIVAVIRDGQVITMMLRRAGQPFTPDALRVDRVAG